MKKLILSKSVTIKDKNLMCVMASITFSPGKEGSGWTWLADSDKPPVPISFEIAQYRQSNIILKYGRHELHEIEHVIALKSLGISDIVVRCSTLPPYLTSFELYDAIKDYLIETDEELRYVTITEPVEYLYNDGYGLDRFTKFMPNSNKEVSFDRCYTKWSDLPETNDVNRILSYNDFIEMMKPFPQGCPKIKYYLALLLSFLIQWPHMNRVTWIQEYKNNEAEVSELLHRHRVCDLVGLVQLIHYAYLPSLRIDTKCGGHYSDLMALFKAKGRIALVP